MPNVGFEPRTSQLQDLKKYSKKLWSLNPIVDNPVFQIPSSVFRIPRSVFRTHSSVFRIPSSVFRIPSSVYRIPSSVSRIPSSVYFFCPFSCIFLSLLTRGHYYNLVGIRSSRRKLLNERDRRPIWGCWGDLERMRSRARARNTSADTVSHKFSTKSEEHQLVYCSSTFAIHITLCISVAILE